MSESLEPLHVRETRMFCTRVGSMTLCETGANLMTKDDDLAANLFKWLSNFALCRL